MVIRRGEIHDGIRRKRNMLNAIATAVLVAAASPDETAILDAQARFVAAWNKHDPEALAAFYTDDAVRVGASGEIAHGKKEIVASFAKLFHGPFAGATVKTGNNTVRMLGDDYALTGCTIDFGDRHGYVVELVTRRDGKWLVLESHPKLYPAH
jgi:uncharacterized protein (TIGR02246 family)